jgi:uncharacterized lipoprotein YajG
MKMILPILALAFLVGCGNNSNSTSNPPSGSYDTNNATTNSMVNNNTPAISDSMTNSSTTNIPATTNQ